MKFLAERIAATERVSESWEQIVSLNPEIRNEEIVLRNTFLNSKLEENDKSGLSVDKKKAAKLKKKKTSTTPDKKKRKIKWVDELNKPKNLETDHYGVGYKALRPKFNPGLLPSKSILRGVERKVQSCLMGGSAKKDNRNNDSSLLNKAEVFSLKHGHSSANRKKEGILLQPQRPKSHSYQQDDSSIDSEIERAGKMIGSKTLTNQRLLHQGQDQTGSHQESRIKTPVTLSHSNSFKRIDSAKAKRGETPTRRDTSEKDRRKTPDNAGKHKEETGYQQNYAKPPASKKMGDIARKPDIDSAIDKIRKENNYLLKNDSYLGDSSLKEHSDLQNSTKKRINKSEMEDKDGLNGNLSKNR